MRVGIEVSVLDLPWATGVQRGLRQLLAGVRSASNAPEVILLGPRLPRHLPPELAVAFPTAFGPDLPASLWRVLVAPRMARRLGLEVWHSPVQALPPGLACPRVATLHELSWAVTGGTRDEGARWRRRRATALMVARADRILAVSHHSRDTLLRLFPEVRDRCQVVPQGVAEDFFAARPAPGALAVRHGLPSPPWLLVLGRALARKGVDRAVAAAAALARRDPAPWTLVLAGPPTPALARARRMAGRLGIAHRVVAPGWIPEEDLPALLASAAVLMVPSRSEGFGLPVLEAMAAGTPVVASRAGALPEVAGAAALLADFDRPEEVAAALIEALGPGRERLRTAGRARARAFPVARQVQGHLAAWREVAAGGQAG